MAKQKKTDAERLKELFEQIEAHKAAIAERRDKLRAAIEDVTEIVDSLTDADESLETGMRLMEEGVDRMSEYL